MSLVISDRVKETSTTTGTGAYALAGAAVGFRAFSTVLANADTTYYVATDGTDWETGLGTYATSGNTLARTTVYASSNSGAAVNWASGVRDVFIAFPATGMLWSANNLSELTASKETVLANLGLLPAGQSGGTNGKVVRLSAANTWVDASQADTVDQLVGLAFRSGGAYWPPGTYITGLSGLTAGSVYYLSTAGGLTATAPTPSASVRRVVIGKAVNATTLLFWPGTPISG